MEREHLFTFSFGGYKHEFEKRFLSVFRARSLLLPLSFCGIVPKADAILPAIPIAAYEVGAALAALSTAGGFLIGVDGVNSEQLASSFSSSFDELAAEKGYQEGFLGAGWLGWASGAITIGKAAADKFFEFFDWLSGKAVDGSYSFISMEACTFNGTPFVSNFIGPNAVIPGAQPLSRCGTYLRVGESLTPWWIYF